MLNGSEPRQTGIASKALPPGHLPHHMTLNPGPSGLQQIEFALRLALKVPRDEPQPLQDRAGALVQV